MGGSRNTRPARRLAAGGPAISPKGKPFVPPRRPAPPPSPVRLWGGAAAAGCAVALGGGGGGGEGVYGWACDGGGNPWVAGGREGLFLMRASAGGLSGHFEKFGIAAGLHPYGWVNGQVAKAMGVPEGSPADKSPSL